MGAPDLQTIFQDPRRLEVVKQAGLLDSQPEECFDRLTQLAAKILNVPVAFISVAGDRRYFYKSYYSEAGGAERDRIGPAISGHAMLSETPVVVGDMTVCPELQQCGTGSCVASRLTVSGEVVGSFCAVAFEPRSWSQTDIEVVEQLARSATREVELRVAVRNAEEKAVQAVASRLETSAIRSLAASVDEMERENGRTASAERTRARVLVVEDDPSMRRLIARTIAGDGLEIAEARDGEEALELLRRDPADLLLLDLMLPHVTGWDILSARARDERLRQMPVIVVSAKRGPDVARALAFGIYGLIPKPFDPADLRDLVQACIAERRG